MSVYMNEHIAQTINNKHPLCPKSNTSNNTNDVLEHNYLYIMDAIQLQHSEHVIQIQRQHKEHIEHLERQVVKLERQVQLLQHHLLRISGT